MKEFAMKHPFLTFFMVDGVLTTIYNCVAMITYHDDWVKEKAAMKIMKSVEKDIKNVIDIAEAKKNESSNDCE